ncbi:MAG: hypothetical protein D6722_23750 [Bacteroidetes bacterium]|nr:MAG: hypothetical protein D6722_23750 [Bacteroidota bacterium]
MRLRLVSLFVLGLLISSLWSGCQSPSGGSGRIDIDEDIYMATDEIERLQRFFRALKARSVSLTARIPELEYEDALFLTVTDSQRLRDSLAVSYQSAANTLQEAVKRALMFPEDYSHLLIVFEDDQRPEGEASFRFPLNPE